jgi:hypothetical protein
LGGCEKKIANFFIAFFFYSPCHETPKDTVKNNRAKQPREKKKKRRKKGHIFCDEPRWTVSKKTIIVFLNSPCYETPKNAIKKIKIKIKIK